MKLSAGTATLLPVPSDKIARALVFVGNLLHSVGAAMLTAANEELTAELDEARAAILELNRRAYDKEFGPGADVDEHQGADVDEYQGADVDDVVDPGADELDVPAFLADGARL